MRRWSLQSGPVVRVDIGVHMARNIDRLNARSVVTITKPGRHADGGGLYLTVDKSGARRWVFLYRRADRLREMGLGGLNSVSLADARKAAAKARADLQAGIDPIAAKNVVPETMPTFGKIADDFIETMTPQFCNAKHIAQWTMTLTTYASALRDMPVDTIRTEDVLNTLKPIWGTKPETASRLRGRIERVLDAAKARGYRSGENPAMWRGNLSNVLPKRRKLSRGHHAALDFRSVPDFVFELRNRKATAARMLEFTILTAARSGEAREATWKEIDTTAAVWTIPGERMKASREHRVPLAPAALAVLAEMGSLGTQPDAFVFPGLKTNKPLSVMAMDMMLRRMEIDVTVHGFRSSFRDWCGEATTFPRETT